jgi:protein-tyrosine-phosphatase
MNIHFVCTGNTFRSRLAESYLNSKHIPGLKVSSSGIEAINDVNGPITWYAQRIIEEQKLVPGEKMIWTQTTKELLESADLVIFMLPQHFDTCVTKFGFKGKNYEIWDVEDVLDDNTTDDKLTIQKSELVFEKIKANIEDLIARSFVPKNF